MWFLLLLTPFNLRGFGRVVLCSKECKNSIFGRYLSLLTTCGSFSNTAAEHLTVGHTHEDVGISKSELAIVSYCISSLLGILQHTSKVVHTPPVPFELRWFLRIGEPIDP